MLAADTFLVPVVWKNLVAASLLTTSAKIINPLVGKGGSNPLNFGSIRWSSLTFSFRVSAFILRGHPICKVLSIASFECEIITLPNPEGES